VTDATANCGGNTISFCLSCGFSTVNAVEIDSVTYQTLDNNLMVYKINNAHLYHADYLDMLQRLTQDVVFIDPPWGGRDYIRQPSLDLYLGSRNVADISDQLLSEKRASLVVLKVPVNYNLNYLVRKLSSRTILTHKMYRSGIHSYNVVFCWDGHPEWLDFDAGVGMGVVHPP
jgi:16S rRNA G966 N2-methylase RsmD